MKTIVLTDKEAEYLWYTYSETDNDYHESGFTFEEICALDEKLNPFPPKTLTKEEGDKIDEGLRLMQEVIDNKDD